MSALSELSHDIAACTDCPLSAHRNRAVPGEGSETADILFIGEAPGWHEDQQGRPFVGPAGQLLNELLASIGLSREDVYIANVIKCRPPSNRDPLPAEIGACRKWLDRQIEIINPRLIVTLGRYSLTQFFPGEAIGKAHGKLKRSDGRLFYVMYHPAAALHQASLRKTIQEDMQRIPAILSQAEKVKEEEPEPKQLPMF